MDERLKGCDEWIAVINKSYTDGQVTFPKMPKEEAVSIHRTLDYVWHLMMHESEGARDKYKHCSIKLYPLNQYMSEVVITGSKNQRLDSMLNKILKEGEK